MTDADTCRELVTPKLVAAGWGTSESVIGEQHSFTNGRTIVAGGKARRGKQRRADNLVCYRSDLPLAVVDEPPCRRSQWHSRPDPRRAAVKLSRRWFER